MMKNLLERLRRKWPVRPEQTTKEATEVALRVFPRCC